MSSPDVPWTTVRVESTDEPFIYDGVEFKFEDFYSADGVPAWGIPPLDARWRNAGAGAYSPRNAGNDDPYVYIVDLTDFYTNDELRIALVDATTAP